MAIGVWMGLLLVMATYAIRLNVNLDVTATWVMVWLMGGLVGTGMLAPNIWVGLFFGWVGLQVVWQQFVHRCVRKDLAALQATLREQGGVLMAALLYLPLTLSHRGDSALFWLAVSAVLWSGYNSVCAGWSRAHGNTLKGRVLFRQEMWVETAYVGSNHMLGWLCGLGILSALYLAALNSALWLLFIPLIAFGAVVSKNFTGIGSGLVGIIAYCGGLWGWKWLLVAGIPLIAAFVVAKYRHDSALTQIVLRVQLWKYMWKLKQYCWTGHGLGYFFDLKMPAGRSKTTGDRQHWDHMHSEWLQGFLELGPLAPICALGYMVGHWLALPAIPDAAYAFGLVALTAAQALTYFPLHLPGQTLPLLVAMAALDGRPS